MKKESKGLWFFLALLAVTALQPAVAKETRWSTGLGAGATEFDHSPAGMMAASATYRLSDHWEVELTAEALHTLERAYDDGSGKTYQAECAWTTLGLRGFLSLGSYWETGLKLASGTGLLQFRYERPYRDSLVWTEELLDRVTMGVMSLEADWRFTPAEGWYLALHGGWRFSSPLETPFLDDAALSGPYAYLKGGIRL